MSGLIVLVVSSSSYDPERKLAEVSTCLTKQRLFVFDLRASIWQPIAHPIDLLGLLTRIFGGSPQA